MDRLPIIDFSRFRSGSPAEKLEVGRQIDYACRDTGFFYISHYGIDPQIIDSSFDAAASFFALPESEKEKIAIDHSPVHRGWYRLYEEVLNPDTAPRGDRKEGIKIGRDCGPDHPRVRAHIPLHGPNQWPDIPHWRPTMEATYSACVALGRDLMGAIALGLGLKDSFFEPWLREPMATLSPIFYPPTPAGSDAAGEYGAGAHTDFGCLTLLFQQNIGGLQIQTQSGDWQDAPPRAGCAVVNIGDMLARWTNDRYRSTRHRVVNASPEARQSIAFFFDPDPDADLSPLPGCQDEPAHYPQTTALAHLLEKIDASFSYRQADASALDTKS